MRRLHTHLPGRLRLLTCVVLGLLLVRAYVPAGFMPAQGQPFALEICPDGLAVPMPPQHVAHVHHPGMAMPMATPTGSHHGNHQHFENCPFGSLPATGLVAASMGIEPAAVFATRISAPAVPLRLYARRDRAHLPRGPPSPA